MILLLDEAIAGALVRAASECDARGDGDGARLLVHAVRRHRVGAIKQRALMAAKGIAV